MRMKRFFLDLCKVLPKIDPAFRTLIEYGHYADRGVIIVYDDRHASDARAGIDCRQTHVGRSCPNRLCASRCASAGASASACAAE